MATRPCSRTGKTRWPPLPEASLRQGLGRYFSGGQLARLGSARVGIAGAGGLGSNTALLLARSGLENMLIIDHDVVDKSNLNRQHYWPRHLGAPKVQALGDVLLELNPHMRLDLRQEKIHAGNLAGLLPRCSIWVEALDDPEAKALLVENALLAGAFTVAASGLCGIGGEPLRKKRLGNLVLVGDFRTSAAMAHPYAPRVTQAAALMADSVLEHILESPGC